MTHEERARLWEKYEDTAMHFNDLILRLRTHALGGLTAIIALSGIAVNFSSGPTTSEQWDVVFGTLIFLIFAWIAIALLDLCYYHTLLLGAVDALLELEEGSEIRLSTKIEEQFGRRENIARTRDWPAVRWILERCWPVVFYSIGLSALVVSVAMTKYVSYSIHRAGDQPSKALQLRVDRDPSEKVELKIDPSSKP